MLRLAVLSTLACVTLQVLATPAAAQTFTANTISHRSSGSGTGNWTLDQNGYVGTYFTLADAGPVTISASAFGATNDAVAPRMNFVIADTKAGFDVAPSLTNYEHTFNLPAGTYFVRTEFANDVSTANRQLTLANFSISGATAVSNSNSTSTKNANALAAADSYVENFRKGNANLAISGAAPGSQVQVSLKRHAFNFGTAVGGTFVGGGTNSFDVNTYLNNANYSNFLRENFNSITPGNAGKWDSNASSSTAVNMAAVDRLYEYADANDMGMRMHNLIWGSQQPNWVNTLLTSAAGGNATSKTTLRNEISERIDYYVGDNDADVNDDRTRRYYEMDVLNEHVHQPSYMNVFGAEGVASIFTETASAVAAAGANTKLFLNEYNVLQYGFDGYANWYREDVEEIVNAGGAVSGVGIQYYPFNVTDSNAHSPARINQIFQNLAVTGLPISLTEFGVQTGNSTTTTQAATYLTDTMRMVFGSPSASAFTIWGFWANDIWNQAPLAALRDASWGITPAGTAFANLMAQWDTNLTLEVGDDGTIDFRGFYGIYEVTVNDETFLLDLTKGNSLYSLVAAAGDFNGDGIVDAVDYTVWRDTHGSTTDFRADGNGDRMIDDADYAIWKSHFGTNYLAGGGQSATVPEPASALLFALFVAITAGGSRIRVR
jgi:endo-1,4-beta-xylanase